MKTRFLSIRRLLAGLPLLIAMPMAAAQGGVRPDPADSRNAGLAAKPDSAFADYQPMQQPPMRSWKQANQDVADNPGMAMGSMPNMPGMSMSGMGSKPGAAPKAGGAGHDMGNMPGMGSKPGAAPKAGAAGHDMGNMPGMSSKPGAAPKAGAAGHDMGGMPGMGSKPGEMQNNRLAGTGLVRSVDKSSGLVKLTHDPIAAMGWPSMTISFRLKDRSLADRAKEGDKVEFTLEKSAAGYVIADLKKGAVHSDAKAAK